ncbi:hypothetical protein [Shewanella waksmanii]|uniref:hypothetical protein n=1 Tax=Shewanella waksmanii TaxID=213783 RepID=UPI00048AB92E|nr:hypothetical protein [Shewanella waksmanii]
MSAHKPNSVTASLFVLLTLLCLMQNSGINLLVKAAQQSVLLAAVYVPVSDTLLSDPALSSDVSSCELSEKSVRVCSENASVVAILWVLLLLPLLRLTRNSYSQIISNVVRAPPRRVHLTLCRFQE